MSLSPVQISTPGAFGSSLTATTTLTGVTAGNHILVIAMHGDLGGNSPTLSASDGQGSYSSDLLSGGGGGVARTQLFRLTNATAGTHTITVTASTGTPSQSVGEIVALELPPVTLDQSNVTGGSGTAVSVAATATLAGTGELAIAAIWHGALTSGGGTFPPTGGTGTYTAVVSKTNESDADYQTLTSTAGAGASWGTFSFSSKYTALVGVYLPVSQPPCGMQLL